METTKEVKSAIKILNKLGNRILEIEGSFYVILSFEEAQSTNWKHSLKGKNVDDIITNFVNIGQNDTSQHTVIIQKITECPIVTKYFHPSYKFILHET
jgi:hypothetical protein